MIGLAPIGGGAGGEGGASIRLGGRRIRIGAAAVLRTRGGAGGHGATASLGSGLVSGTGGGGGGGAAGTLHLLARSVLQFDDPARFAPDVEAGAWGQGGASFERRAFVSSPGNLLGDGIFPVEANTLYGLSLIGRSKFFLGGPELVEVDPGGAAVPFESQVRTRQTLDLQHQAATLGSPLPLERLTLVNADGTRTIPASRVSRGGTQIVHWPMLLAPGLNTLTLGGTGTLDTALRRVVLVVTGPDTDGDHISSAEEVRLGLNPESADTDGDGVLDGDEAPTLAGGGSTGGPVPGSGGSSTDRDGDGWPDTFELAFHTDPSSNTSFPRQRAQAPGELALCPTIAQPPVRLTKSADPDFSGLDWNTVIAQPPVSVLHQ